MADSTYYIYSVLDDENQFSDDGITYVEGESDGLLTAQSEVRYGFEASTDFEGIVTVQAKFKRGPLETWFDVGEIKETTIKFDQIAGALTFRFGIKQGNYTAGHIKCYIDGVRG